MSKKLLSREMICEWLNPVLSDSTSDNPFCQNQNIMTPNVQNDFSDILIEPPMWLNPNGCEGDNIANNTAANYYGPAKEVLGAMFINGMPLSSWGAMYGGNQQFWRKNVMNNYFDVLHNIRGKMSDINLYDYIDNDNEIEITNFIVQRMVPSDAGYGVNIYISFDYNGENIFAKYSKFGIEDSTGYQFLCEPILNSVSEETFIRVKGKIKNILNDWLCVKSGIYKCLANEVLTYNNFGQILRLKKDDIIEVIKSDTNKIQFNHKDQKLMIKTPTLYWFNYWFEKIK